MRARDIMDKRFHTLRPDQSIAEAVKLFQTASTEEQKKIFGLMVVDERERLVGMLSMYDIQLFIRPKHAAFWGEIENLPLEGVFDELVDRVKSIRVADIMTTDVVALLYRYCRTCPKSISRKDAAPQPDAEVRRLSVNEVMTSAVVSFPEDAFLAHVIEGLTSHRFGAVLISDDQGAAQGVISKTDLVRAYHHGASLDVEAPTVMSAPVVSYDRQAYLQEALRYMFLQDVQRLFVHAGTPAHIVGVLSLSDAARIRSGSCQACIPSRFITAD